MHPRAPHTLHTNHLTLKILGITLSYIPWGNFDIRLICTSIRCLPDGLFMLPVMNLTSIIQSPSWSVSFTMIRRSILLLYDRDDSLSHHSSPCLPYEPTHSSLRAHVAPHYGHLGFTIFEWSMGRSFPLLHMIISHHAIIKPILFCHTYDLSR